MATTPQHESVVLTIAGSDSGGGAGIQADLKTFEAHGVFGLSAITALTAQNSQGVQGVLGVSEAFVASQLEALLSDFRISAAKTGMLYSAGIISTVAHCLKGTRFPLVVDPVMVATSGHDLMEESALHALRESLLPLATVITPNIPEAEKLSGMEIHDEQGMETAAQLLSGQFPQAWILIKGGHLAGAMANDLLFHASGMRWIEAARINTQDTHGTGCTLSAAIAAGLARGKSVPDAVADAKAYLTGALQNAWHGLGGGRGSLRHHWASK